MSYLNERKRSGLAGKLFGAALVCAGLATLALLVVVTNCSTTACDRWTVRLGLAGTAVLSALAQAGLIIGAWLVLRSSRRSQA